jgi:hypothetical protein
LPVRLGLSAASRKHLPVAAAVSAANLLGSTRLWRADASPPRTDRVPRDANFIRAEILVVVNIASLEFARPMSRTGKLFDKLMSGQNDASFSFDHLCTLLMKLGYTMRKTKGSHIIFQRGSSFLNLQPIPGGKAKAYQVRQVRQELQKLNLKP